MNANEVYQHGDDGFTNVPAEEAAKETLDCGDAVVVTTATGMSHTHTNIVSVKLDTMGHLIIESQGEEHAIKTTYADGQWVSFSQLSAYAE